jgi:hypothetical protein
MRESMSLLRRHVHTEILILSLAIHPDVFLNVISPV